MDDDFAYEFDAYEDISTWEEIASKSVMDADGFYTDYTLWYNTASDEYVCIFGDKDIYDPTNYDADAEFDNEDEAREWFDSYNGFEDDFGDMIVL